MVTKYHFFSFVASKAAIATSDEEDKLQKLEGQVEHYKVVLAETVRYSLGTKYISYIGWIFL